MKAIQSACRAVSSELAENPECEKPSGAGKQTVKMDTMYDVMRELHSAVTYISNYLRIIGHKPEVNQVKLNKLEEKVKDLESERMHWPRNGRWEP